jgi:small subunit ribosomal protein S1
LDKERPEAASTELSAEEESFETLLESGGGHPAVFDPGDEVTAVITQISKEWTFVDFGGKADGYIETQEFLTREGEITIQPGDTVSAFFLPSPSHNMRFTTRLAAESAETDRLEAVYQSNIPLEGVVEREIKGGFAVKVAGNTRVFCPYSQMTRHKVQDPGQYIGQRLTFKITQYEKGGRNIVVSRRAILEEEGEKAKKTLRNELQEGMMVKGTITAVAPFGAFVDIGGLEGLIPISEVAWGRVEDVHGLLQAGQEVDVVAKSLDWENDRLSFSLKEAQTDPWQNVADKYPEGSTHAGIVARLAPFGAFVTLEPGIDGLLHISELGKEKRIHHPKEVLAENQAIEVKIGRVDERHRRLSLEVPAKGSRQQDEFEKYMADDRGSGSMGTLGEILQAKMAEKKKS